jgi:hypothetical protein
MIPDPDFLPIPDPRVKKAPDPGSGSATLIFIAYNNMPGEGALGKIICQRSLKDKQLQSGRDVSIETLRMEGLKLSGKNQEVPKDEQPEIHRID